MELSSFSITTGASDGRWCPRCKQLSLVLVDTYLGRKDDPDPHMRETVYHWKCGCGYTECGCGYGEYA